jgi:predicted DNA-binding transcriptional regulator AlpA
MAYRRKRHKLENVEAFRIPDAVRAYSVGASTIYGAIKNGELAASKLGTSPRSPVVITRAAIEQWLERGRIKPRTE